MKEKFSAFFSVVVLALPSLVFAQGPLSPPGAPTPTMKTLDQIEARTPISSAPFTITNTGSYYLTQALTVSSGNAIVISTNRVTLDLNGFTISSTAPSATGTGILLNTANDSITILNGRISGGVTNSGTNYSGPGFANGIAFSATPGIPVNIHVSSVAVSGCLSNGIDVAGGNGSVVESCSVSTVSRTPSSFGIRADNVTRCSVHLCGGIGISASMASDCYSYSTGSGDGFSVNVANNCYGYNTGNGIGLAANIANNCLGFCASNGTGVFCQNGVATGCYAGSVSGVGLSTTIANSCRVASGTTNVTFKYNMP